MTKGDDGKVIHCMLTIPYDDACIREIKLNLTQTMQHLFHDLADRINSDRRAWLGKAEFDLERKNRMQVRNLGDTASAALESGCDRRRCKKEAVKQGIENRKRHRRG